MVFGIGEGKIEITTEKPSYMQGELLKGKVKLELNSAKKARQLRVQFYGERRTGSGKSSRMEKTFLQELVLDGEKEYPAGARDYDFQFQLPTIPKLAQSQGSGIIDVAVNMLASFADPFSSTKWYLDASLDVPMGIDVNKKQLLNFVR